MVETLKTRIQQRLTDLGLTPEGASKRAGLSRDFLRQLLHRTSGNPRANNLVKLAAALETTPTWLLEGEGAKEAAAPIQRPTEEYRNEVRSAEVEVPQRLDMSKDVPVMGTAAGSVEGEFQFEGGVIDYVRRPPALANAKDIYTIYVVGSSMEPRYHQGDLCFINPNKPARIGDPVIVQLRDGEHEPIKAIIGHLTRRTADTVFIGKLNPVGDVSIPMATVLRIHKVLDMNELFGV